MLKPPKEIYLTLNVFFVEVGFLFKNDEKREMKDLRMKPSV
jgi:hypothetical protein